MSKRSATEQHKNEGQAFQKASGSGAKREKVNADEMGEFEDAWEDEIESDEEAQVCEGNGEQDPDGIVKSESIYNII